MNTNMTRLLSIVCALAALVLNVACSESSSNVWSNADYGAGTASGAPHYMKTVSGMALMN